MLFWKKKIIQSKDDNLSYYMHRDSLTSLYDKGFAVAEFERLKEENGYGAVLVSLTGADNMPLYEAEDKIKRTARILSYITDKPISRLCEGDFIIFTLECEALADKIYSFLKEFSEEGILCGAGAKRFDENEKDFGVFLKRIYGCATLSSLPNVGKAVY